MTGGKTASLLSDRLVRRLRIGSGLVMFAFVALHLANHALALISLQTAEAGRHWFSLIWRNPIGTTLFYGSVLVHAALALWALYQRRTLRMPAKEAAQIILGLLIPLLIIDHAIGTRLPYTLYERDLGYENVFRTLWISAPMLGLKQSIAVIVVWFHACIGIYFWLRYRSWYATAAPLLFSVAIILPVLALLGFASGGRSLAAVTVEDFASGGYNLYISPSPRDIAAMERLEHISGAAIPSLYLVFLGSILTVFALRILRLQRQKSSQIEIRYAHGAAVRIPRGLSLLEASRVGGVPHYSACGGKGRCSTCRVRIIETGEPLPAPEPLEQATLQRVYADHDVRLGCQLRPEHDLTVALLFSPDQTDALPQETDAARPGREEEIAVLFCDLRNFTTLTETRLPYDTVFLLNRYFSIVGQAVEQAGGRLDKFIGDGAMALFGLKGQTENACRNALKAAAIIVREINRLHDELRGEFPVRLRVAISVHTGPSIVGVMGYGNTKSLTAIGDTINVASRLETVAKELDVAMIVSEPAIIQAQVPIDDLESRKIEIRGRRSPMRVYLVPEEASSRFI